MFKRPFILGIAGASCSGKTSLARRLAEMLDGDALVFELDWYYHDRSDRDVDEINVDVPDALDGGLIVEQLGRLAGGGTIERPVYDYTTHARAAKGVALEPASTIIVEGLFTLHWPALRELLDASVFIQAEHGICLARRIARDTSERGRTIESVMRQYHETVKPMYEEHVHPTRHLADLLMHGEDSVESLTDRVLDMLRAD